MKVIRKVIVILFNCLMALRSLFWKKDNSIVIMDSWFGERFADNPRFLFQFLSENKEILGLTHVVWVTHSELIINELHEMGYEAVLLGSRESIRYHKLAKYHICNNSPSGSKGRKNEIDAFYSFRAIRINLWHGIGVKGGVFCSNEYMKKKKKHPLLCTINELLQDNKFYRTFFKEPGGWGDCFWLTTTPAFTEYLHKWMLGPYNKYLELDYPRNKKCLKYTNEEARVIELLKQFEKTVLYLPTYRTETTGFEFNSLVNELNDKLLDNGFLWIQKAHSADNYVGTKEGKNILTLHPDFDINVLIPYVTVVITDYSSVSIDALYHNKPVIYYVPDWDNYSTSDRGFVEKVEDYFAGPFTKTSDEVFENLITIPSIDEQYKYVRNRYWKSGLDYEDIWNGIKNLTH